MSDIYFRICVLVLGMKAVFVSCRGTNPLQLGASGEEDTEAKSWDIGEQKQQKLARASKLMQCYSAVAIATKYGLRRHW